VYFLLQLYRKSKQFYSKTQIMTQKKAFLTTHSYSKWLKPNTLKHRFNSSVSNYKHQQHKTTASKCPKIPFSM